MKKVSDFRNTWCLYSVDTFKKFKEIWLDGNLGSFTELCSTKDMVIVCNDRLNVEVYEYCDFKRINDSLKQIHLVDGEFYYVGDTNVIESKIEKIEDSFNKFGFETPNWDGEILKKVEGCLIGWHRHKDSIISCSWNTKGICYSTMNYKDEYNLTPLKVNWWEKEDNFRIAVKNIKDLNYFIDKDGNIEIMSKNTDKKGNSRYSTNGCHTPIEWLKCYRPATKEECLSLCIKE